LSISRASLLHVHMVLGRRRQPAAAEGLEQAQYRLQTREPRLRSIVLGTEQRLLQLEHGGQVNGALAQADLGDGEGALGGVERLHLQTLELAGVGHCNERLLDIGKGGDNDSAIAAEQLELAALRRLELALEPEAVEYRLRQVGCDLVENRLRCEQIFQRRAGDA